jgi:5'-nucleotidase
MRILVTNDDGIHALGLLALRAALLRLGEVVAIAPDRPRSACGHAVTLHKPLRLTPVELPGGTGYASNGTPSDCVALGVGEQVGPAPDLVVAGINAGPNLGWDLTYSGTVAAAMEAAICGLPSIAISVTSYTATDFAQAAEFAAYLSQVVIQHGLPQDTFLNVNVPALPASEIKGVAVTHQGRLIYENRIERRTDPRGGDYYWFSGDRVDHRGQPGSDIEAVAKNRISVTPVHLDLTDHTMLARLRVWDLTWPGKIT